MFLHSLCCLSKVAWEEASLLCLLSVPRESEDAPQSYTMAKRKSSDSSDLLAENSKHFPLQNRAHEVSGEGGGKDRRIHLKQPWSLRKDWLEMRILFPHQQRMKTLPGTSYQISAVLNLPSHWRLVSRCPWRLGHFENHCIILFYSHRCTRRAYPRLDPSRVQQTSSLGCTEVLLCVTVTDHVIREGAGC